MQVSNFLVNNTYTPARVINNKTYSTNMLNFRGGISCDTVHFSKDVKQKPEDVLDKFSEFSTEEYLGLSNDEIETLRDAYKSMVDERNGVYMRGSILSCGINFDDLVVEHESLSNHIKNTLDEKYGEGNYRVITIGRSLSSIGKTLGYKIGEENVVNIPLSDAGNFLEKDYLEKMLKHESADEMKKFLKKNNLDKETVENSDKTYVLMDYCLSGNSLKGAKALLTEDCFMGQKNVETMSIRDCVPHAEFDERHEKDFYWGKYKYFSFAEPAVDLDAQKHVTNTKTENLRNRLVWFNLLDNQMRNRDNS